MKLAILPVSSAGKSHSRGVRLLLVWAVGTPFDIRVMAILRVKEGISRKSRRVSLL
jgi:hypothetical protein